LSAYNEAYMQPVLDWLQHNRDWMFSGAGVTIITVIGAWLVSRKSQGHARDVRVNLAFGMLGLGPKLSDQMLLFTVTNAGDRPIQIARIRIPLSGNRNVCFPRLNGERNLPCMLEAQTSLKFWTDLKELQSTLRSSGHAGKICAVVTDGIGAEYGSNRVAVE
jgi:hypothetical protein